MKSKEEIEQLAEKAIPLSNENIDYIEFAKHDRKQWVKGYTQCQEDMADKKYTKAQMKACFYHNCIDNAKVIFDDYLKKYVTD